MGVMACCRYDCENIMCDRYVSGIGYICDECYAELLVDKSKWPITMPKDEVKQRIVDFMNTNKGHGYQLEGGEIDTEFDRIVGPPKDEFDY